jgi:hypothetical protein
MRQRQRVEVELWQLLPPARIDHAVLRRIVRAQQRHVTHHRNRDRVS